MLLRSIMSVIMTLCIVIPSGAVTICLDPGHPSEVNAACTVQNGVTELAMNWQVAQRLASLLRAHDITVVMTKRSRDEFITNRRRAEIANAVHAALLLRLHCDTGRGSGFALYYPDHAGKHDGHVGPSAAVMAASKRAAGLLHAGMVAALGATLRDNGIKTDRQTAVGRKQGALTGSIFSTVPVVTVEMVVLSHKADADFIRNAGGQQRIAEALAESVRRYVHSSAVKKDGIFVSQL